MKAKKSLPVIAVGCSLLFATGALAADQKDSQTQKQMDQQKQEYSQQNQQQSQQQTKQQKQGQNQYAQSLITPEKIKGMKIQNKQGEEVGSVDKVVLDGEQGQIAYLVVTSGGFWGIGGEKAVVPWKAVKFQQQGQQPQQGQQQQQSQGEPVLIVDVTKDQLKNAPQGEIQTTLDRNQAEEIHKHYGVSPYWEGQPGQSGQKKQDQKLQMQNQQNQQNQQMKNQQQQQQNK